MNEQSHHAIDGSVALGASSRSVFYQNHVKRLFDIAFSAAALVLTAPIIACFSLLIMVDGHAPFYRQQRVGLGGKVFTIIKLRSMRIDADRMLEAFLAANPAARREWDETQKLRNDPRITPVGRIIRKASLDELPQFFNVLRGEMSVVGPRPIMPAQQSVYPGEAYYEMRPGITGLWQIGERNDSTFAARARFDADYYERLGFAMDLSIIVRTVAVMVRGTGV